MSNLKDLVPSVELCKLIPEGEFADSAFVWLEVEILQESKKEWRVINATKPILACHNPKHPAPTLEEIIRKIRLDLLCGIEHHGDFYVANRHIGCFEDERAATAALKVWLKLKGIEV